MINWLINDDIQIAFHFIIDMFNPFIFVTLLLMVYYLILKIKKCHYVKQQEIYLHKLHSIFQNEYSNHFIRAGTRYSFEYFEMHKPSVNYDWQILFLQVKEKLKCMLASK